MKKTDMPLDWVNIAFLTLSPLAAIVGGTLYTLHFGLHVSELALFVVMFFATGLSITGGYHRHFAHVSYHAHPLLRIFFLVFGACAFQNSALNWAADHRLHHRFTDTDKDPYDAGQGFWFSHMGWVFFRTPVRRDFMIVGDLVRNKWIKFQHNHHLAIGLLVGFGIPLLVGLATHDVVGMLLWGGLIRVVVVHHATFLINSLAHMWGAQPYSRSDSSKDSWWLALLTNGEGYHNFHHRFPSDYRNGIRWYQWDPTKWLIAGMNLLGVTRRLHRIPPQLILRAQLEMQAIDAEKRLQSLPQSVEISWRDRMELARKRFEQAIGQWAETRTTYREFKANAIRDSEGVRRQLKIKMLEYETHLKKAKVEWKETLQGFYRQPAQNVSGSIY